jgi:hypothetical protein
LGDRLFEQLDEEVWANIGAGPEYTIVRYNSGSMADSQHQNPNQNRSFEFTADSPRGGTSFAAWYV